MNAHDTMTNVIAPVAKFTVKETGKYLFRATMIGVLVTTIVAAVGYQSPDKS